MEVWKMQAIILLCTGLIEVLLVAGFMMNLKHKKQISTYLEGYRFGPSFFPRENYILYNEIKL